MHVLEFFLSGHLGASGIFQQDLEVLDTQKHMLLCNFMFLGFVKFSAHAISGSSITPRQESGHMITLNYGFVMYGDVMTSSGLTFPPISSFFH
jgi:hypothetical protein